MSFRNIIFGWQSLQKTSITFAKANKVKHIKKLGITCMCKDGDFTGVKYLRKSFKSSEHILLQLSTYDESLPKAFSSFSKLFNTRTIGASFDFIGRDQQILTPLRIKRAKLKKLELNYSRADNFTHVVRNFSKLRGLNSLK